ncbi:hypothetical protein M378DRAFT_90974 [Amanita muscaria Koide BX008]|uniref:Uncharacterized protein n=1 Tax=Amanita muscaria (strain Koide BX008) TaxID=946122 RepID=A0A0C2W2R0_AMAMK|nr:hypothetical protein M378DRAFT_90974 [Amanita muscaria Koide BX008]
MAGVVLEPSFSIRPAPPLKRRRLDIPARVKIRKAREERQKKLVLALQDIEKLIKSKQDIFEAGQNGLQAYRARAIQSYLRMVVHNKRDGMTASQIAAESQGFAVNWGSRMVRKWVRHWVEKRVLPISKRGSHTKSFSLISDPTIRAELRSFVRSNKWAMDPAKLAEFSKQKMVPEAAKKYLEKIINEEMPRGLKQYMEVELFPRVHLKVGKGERRLVLVAHDEMTAQAHDGKTKSWVMDNEHALKKKGVGRGMHHSEVICSTVGSLKDAGQDLEYGKNYDGYWTGELFVKQLIEKIIPAFEKAHGPGYQALIMVDNSQGHSAYATDALLTSRMNLRPGGKQARLRDGSFMCGDQKVTQPMNFPHDHPEFPDMPKGMKQKWLRENCDYTFRTLQENLPKALASVEITTIRKWEHRMIRWMDAYQACLTAKNAQFQVKAFSSRQYKSHRRVPERLAQYFDK